MLSLLIWPRPKVITLSGFYCNKTFLFSDFWTNLCILCCVTLCTILLRSDESFFFFSRIELMKMCFSHFQVNNKQIQFSSQKIKFAKISFLSLWNFDNINLYNDLCNQIIALAYFISVEHLQFKLLYLLYPNI